MIESFEARNILGTIGEWRRTMRCFAGMGTEEVGLQLLIALCPTRNENTT